MKYATQSLVALCFFGCFNIARADTENNQQAPAVDRAQVDKSLGDLNDRLTKARAVPYFENGQPAGYKVVQPNSGGVDQKLELKDGDTIKAANEEAVNDPQKRLDASGNAENAPEPGSAQEKN